MTHSNLPNDLAPAAATGKLGTSFSWFSTWQHLIRLFATGTEESGSTRVRLQALEERVLYDASPLMALSPDYGLEQFEDQIDIQLDELSELCFESTCEYPTIVYEDIATDFSSIDAEFPLVESFHDSYQLARQLIVVDERIEGFEDLINDITLQGNKDIAYDVLTLDEFSNGVERITSQLELGLSYEAIHIVAHGSDDRVQLGTAELTSETLHQYQDQITGWASGLDEDADILFYGCEVAASDQGRLLVEQIAGIRGADVAASDDLTGNETLGGDWELEYLSGTIESDLAFSLEVRANWDGVLDAITVETTSDVLDGDAETSLGLVSELVAIDGGELAPQEQTQSRELVFVDAGADDYEQLLNDLLSSADESRNLEVVLLDSNRDGIEQISEALSRYDELDAVHIVSHGTDGAVNLGNTWLNLSNLDVYAGRLVGWGNALAVDADLLLYGCNLAGTSDGRALIDSLGALCDCDVAASDDLTGHGDLGGDWDLEYQLGEIETAIAVSESQQVAWRFVLANQAPTDISFDSSGQVGVGLSAGTVVAIDPDSGDTITYGLVDDASGMFTIDINTGELTWNNPVNTSVVNSYNIIVRATDSGVLSYDESMSIVTGTFANDIVTGTANDDLIYGLDELGTTNYITNGSFESGSTGWTDVNGVGFDIEPSGNHGVTATDGSFYLDMKSTTGFSIIEQSVAGLTNGTTYELSFDAGLTGDGDGLMHVYWNGALLETIDPVSNTLQAYSYDVVAGSGDGTNTVRFDEDGPHSARTTALDNIRLYDVGDQLTGNAGDDYLDGGAGDDTAAFSGNRADYDITWYAATSELVVVDTRPSSPDGTDTLFSIESLQFSDQTIEITDPSAQFNDAPDITSDGGGATAPLNVAENITAVTTVVASDLDGDTLTYSISGGIDAAQFSIDGNSGALTFISAPDYEAPADANTDNVYKVQVEADDGKGGTDTQAISVTVTPVNDAPTITDGFLVALPGADEDSTTAGTTVSAIVNSAGWNDVNAGSVRGMAITGVTGNGTWEYSTDGITWNSFGSVSAINALLLDANSQVRYVGDGENGEVASFGFRGWDTTAGTASTNATPSYTNPGGGGGTSAFSTESATANTTITSLNDAPVLDNTGLMDLPNVLKNVTDPSGSPVSTIIGSAGGDRITDVDPGAVEGIAVTSVDDANGTWQFSTNGGSTWTAFGAVTSGDAVVLTDTANDRIRFVPNTDYVGNATFDFLGWDTTDGNTSGTTGVNTGSGGGTSAFSADIENVSIEIEDNEIFFWYSTESDVGPTGGSGGGPASGTPGLANWSEGEVIGFGDPNMSYGLDATDGTFLSITDFDAFAADSNVDLIGIHYVANDIIVVGPGITGGTIDLQQGDIIFATLDAEALSNAAAGAPAGWSNSIGTNAGDVYVFRAEFADDPTSGYFRQVMSDPSSNGLAGITLVEQATTIGGDTLLAAGDFLFSETGLADKNDISWYDTSLHASVKLIEGDDLGISRGIDGLQFIDEGQTLGGVPVGTGTVFVSLDQTDSIGTNNLSVAEHDVVELEITATTLGSGTAVATAEMVFDGDDVNLNHVAEDIDALTLVVRGIGTNQGPVIAQSGVAPTFVENGAPVIIDSTITVVDSDSPDFASGLLRVDITVGADVNDRLYIFNQGTGLGQIGVDHNTVTYEGATIGTFSGGYGTDPLVFSLNGNADVISTRALMRNITFANVSDDPGTTVRTVEFVLTDGDGSGSNVISQTVNVTEVADAPIALDDTFGLDFDGLDDYVSIADSASLTMTNTMTMEVWINPDASTNVNRMIINKEGEYEVALFADNKIYWAFDNTDPDWAWHDTGYTVTNGEWTHIAITYNNGTVTTHVNGTVVDTYLGSGSIGDSHATLDELRIGGRSNAPDTPSSKFFDGRIDEVRIWNTVRTQGEIQSNLDVALTGLEAGLAGYWNFNEGSGTIAADLTANNNDGVLSEFSASGTFLPTWVGYETDQNSTLNVPIATGVLENDFDPDGDPISAIELNGVAVDIGVPTAITSTAIVTLNGNGSFDYNPNGTFDYLDAGQTAVDSFDYTIDDGTGTATATAYITISGLNDAPTLTNGTLTAVDEDTTNPPGESVATVFSGQFGDVDTSGGFAGIAVVGNTANAGTEGTWQYSTDTGTAWFDIGAVTDGATALALNTSAMLRFVPVADYFGTPTALVVRGLDNTFGGAFTNGATRQTFDTTTNGGETAIAGATAEINTSITAVNDAPIITGGPDSTGLSETNAGLTDSGTLTVSDVDTTDLVTSAVDSVVVTGTGAASVPGTLTNAILQGFLTVSPTAILDGTETTDTLTWDFNSGSEAFDFLATGETLILTYTVSATDDDGTPLGDTETVTVTVTGTNDGPQATNLSAAEAYIEDVALNLTDIVVSDVDDGNLTVALTLSDVAAGSLNTGTSGAVTSTFVGGVWTASGAIGDVNALLAALTFTPSTSYASNFTIATSVDDGEAAPLTGIKNFTATPANDAPEITGGPDTTGLTETNAGLTDSGTLTVSDADLTDVVTAAVDSVVVTGTGAGSVPGTLTNPILQGFLTVSPTAILDGTETTETLTWDFNSGSEAFDFLATGETLILTYTVSATDDNGTPLSDTETVTVTITGTNDGPQATNLSASESYTEDVALDLIDIVVSDVDDSDATVTLTLSNIGAGSLNTGTSGAVTSTFAGGVWTASGAIADVNTLLAAVTFTPTTSYASAFTISTSVDDGEAAPVTGVKNFTATAMNDAPVVTAPGAALAATEQIGLAIHGTGFSVTDVDEAGVGARAVLSVGEGIITVAEGDSGITIDAGNNSGSVTILGTIAQINNLLTGAGTGMIAYVNNNDAPSASTTFSVMVNDSGNTGNDPGLTGDGTSEQDTNSQIINISAVNDEESLDTNAILTLNEGATAIITVTELATSDVDNTPAQIVYTLDSTPTNGSVSLNYVTLSATDTFTQADIDAGLVRYHHDGGETTGDSLNFTVDDSTGTSTSNTFNFKINPVNDAPVNTLSGQPQTVAGAGLDGATDVHAADLDGDGDVDLVATSWGDDRVTWFQNDGTGSFTEYTIDTGLTGARHVFVADINNDTYLDVLVSDYESDTVTWYENDGTATPTYTAHTVTSSADGAWSSYAIDMDADGDMDVLSASIWDDKVAWYENDGAATPSWTEHVITTNADGVRTVVAGDLDGDGDIDVASASFVDDTIAWYESDGAATPGFTEHVITTGTLGAMSVDIADVDADGNLDLVTASYADGKIAWFQNDGLASPTFSEQVISTSAAGARDVFTVDLDADGDLDILSASFVDDKIAWYENDGAVLPSFTEHLVSQDSDGPRAVAAADLDGDGDIDVIGASLNDDQVGYFENTDGQMGIQVTAEETPLVFNAANNNLVWISDSDDSGLEMKVRLEITNGTISLTGIAGLTVDVGTGSGDAVVEFRGSITDINVALDGMTFTPTNDFNGVASIRILTDDQGNSGSGGALTDDDTINITITPVNDDPTITGGPDTVGLTETDAGLTSSGTLSVSDVDTTDLVTAAVDSVTLSGTGAVSVPGTLTNAILQSFLAVSPTAILDGTETTDTLTWDFNSGSEAFDFLATGETLILTYTISATDDAGTPLSDTETVTVTITGTNDGPQATNLNAAEGYTEDIPLNLTDIVVSDVDDSDVTVTLTLSDIGAGSLNTGTSGAVTSTFVGGVWTASGAIGDVNALLAAVTFTPSASYASDFTIATSVDDGEAAPITGIKNFTTNLVNDAPVITGGPDASALAETNSGLTDSGTLTVSDADVTDVVTAAVDSVVVGGTGASGVPVALTNVMLQSFLSVGPTAILDGTETTDTLNWNFNSGSEAFDFLATGETLILTYTVSATDNDGSPLSDSETVTVTITGTNDAPVEATVEVVPLAYAENDVPTGITSAITIADVDDTNIESATAQITGNYVSGQDNLAFTNTGTITGVWNAVSGTLTLSGSDTLANYESALQSVTYQNTSDNPSALTRTVTFITNDGDNDSNIQTRDINVVQINDDPNNSGSLPTDINAVEETSSDVDLSLLNLNDLDAGTGNLSVTLRTSAGGILSAASGGGVTVAGSGSANITLTGNLSDLNAYLDSITNVQYTGPINLSGNDVDTIQVEVTDNGNTGTGGGGVIGLGVVNVDITNVNDAPVGNADSVTVSESATINIPAPGLLGNDTDIEGDSLTAAVVSGPANGLLVLNPDGSFSYTHDGSETTTDSFVYQVADGNGGFDTQTVTIAVMPVNDAPVANVESYSTAEDTTLISPMDVLANDNDAEGDLLSISLIDPPDYAVAFALNPGGSFNYVPQPDFYGVDTFTYQVDDSNGGVDTATVTITITPVNDTPVGSTDAYTTSVENTISAMVSVLSNDSDVEGDPLTAILLSGPDNGTLSLAPNGTFVYTPDAEFVGVDSFSYIPNDGMINGVATLVNIEVVAGTNKDIDIDKSKEPPDDEPKKEPESITETEKTVEPHLADTLATEPLFDRPVLKLGTISDFDGDAQSIFQLLADRRQAEDVLRIMLRNVDADLLEADDAKRKVDTRFSTAFDPKYLWRDLDSLNDLQRKLFNGMSMSIGAITAVSTLGYIFWSLRGGVLIAAAISQMPNWRLIDPLPVLESYEMKSGSSKNEEMHGFFDNN